MVKRIVGSFLLMATVLAGRSAEPEGDLAASPPAETEESQPASEATASATGELTFYVIPVQDQIGKPTLYVLRTGVKEAVEAGARFIILDMDTPGGALDVTLEMMEILGKFEGQTITYINDEAVSAGAFISAATDAIYFAPSGVIGAAAPVMATGGEIDETMRQKITSYLRARIRSISEKHPYRGEVISAMVDADYELEIDGTVIKPKGELLSLTASEALKTYGDPPQALLAAGIAEDLDSLMNTLANGESYLVRRFEMTWSLELATLLLKVSPILLGLGGMLLFIEFKTPGFGIFGIAGVVLLMTVFLGHNVAGLSGNEPMLVFLLGVALVFVELFFFPGVLVFAISGLILMVGSLLWGMADIWPGEEFEISPDVFLQPAYNLALGFLLALVLIFLVARFLPKSIFWNRMVLASSIWGSSQHGKVDDKGVPVTVGAEPGATGVVVADLHPVGRVEIGGRQYEARVKVGEIRAGEAVRVVRRADFSLIVEPLDT